MKSLGLEFEPRFSAYGQLLQEALNPASESAVNPAGGFNVFLIRPADLGGKVDESLAAIAELAPRSPATQIVVLCPDKGDQTENRPILRRLRELQNVDLVKPSDLVVRYPVAAPFDEEADKLGSIPYTETFFAALATMIARRISVRIRPPYKVLVLDADNTLNGAGSAVRTDPTALTFPVPGAPCVPSPKTNAARECSSVFVRRTGKRMWMPFSKREPLNSL